MKIHCKYDELIPVENLRPYDKNRNNHPEEQIERLAKLLRYQGIRAPLVVTKTQGGVPIIAKGHGTLAAIKLNGWNKAPVVYQEFENEEQLYSYVQSDNAISAWSDLDFEAINIDLVDLGPDFDIDHLGIIDFVLDMSEKEEDQQESGSKKGKFKCPECGYEGKS